MEALSYPDDSVCSVLEEVIKNPNTTEDNKIRANDFLKRICENPDSFCVNLEGNGSAEDYPLLGVGKLAELLRLGLPLYDPGLYDFSVQVIVQILRN